MNIEKSVAEFIDAPDTVDFVLRKGQFLTRFIRDHPDVLVTQTLSGRYVLLYAKTKDFQNIVTELGASFITSASVVMGLLDRQSLDAAGITQVQQQPYLDLNGRGVLVGIVDTGIDYTQNVFRYEDGTSKIQFIYDQSVRGNTPEGFFVGTEYTNAQINEALKATDPYSIVPQKDNAGHGTFLASIAAGREVGDYIGAAPNSELVVVKLKKARPYYLDLYSVPNNQENAFESNAVMIGVEYILAKARQLDRPVVICIGIGSNFGSHDGFSILAEYLSGVANLQGVCVCTSAGNESQARHHMQAVIEKTGDSQNIDIRAGNDAGDIFVSIWAAVSDKLSVSVRSPTGELVARILPVSGHVTESGLILERARIRVVSYFPVERSGSQVTYVKLINATPGIWTITVYGDIILDGTFHAWLPMTGFVAPGVEFLKATPNYTIVIPASMIGAICCGAYDSVNNTLYSQSSWGPTRAQRMAPDLVAPGVDVGGYYPSGYGTMSGTSVAAAITAGASALMLQWGIVDKNDVALSSYQIRAYLIRGCNRSETITYPSTSWGYGSLNLLQTFQFMREV
jgi:subtilisin family serine protease